MDSKRCDLLNEHVDAEILRVLQAARKAVRYIKLFDNENPAVGAGNGT